MNPDEFGRRLKPWLERTAQDVGDLQSTRLRSARLRALDAYREPVRLFGLIPVGGAAAGVLRYSAVQGALLVVPVALAVAVFAWQASREPDLGELDAQLLTQELPPDAFLDQDFRTWLSKPPG